VVIKEYPYLIAEDVYDALYQFYGTDDPDEDVRSIFESMTPFKIDKYMISYAEIVAEVATLPRYMQDTFLNMKPERLRILVAKFYRNAFTYMARNTPPCALLATGTLMNHSCYNNIDFHVDRNGYFLFIANRDITAGEELCDSYLQKNTSVKKRKTSLLTQYGFSCECEKCSKK
jgi:hypothetical protein